MNRRSLLIRLVSIAATTGLMRAPSAHAQGRPTLAARERPPHTNDWRMKLKDELPLLGHRNWILIVDAAYPLQTAIGIETVDTGAPMAVVRQEVLRDLERQEHVRPSIFMDSELRYLKVEDVPGIQQYRQQVEAALGGQVVTEVPHEQLIAKVDDAGKLFHVLILKTTLTMPYTSMFLQLDCRYWSGDSEAKLRRAISNLEATRQNPGSAR